MLPCEQGDCTAHCGHFVLGLGHELHELKQAAWRRPAHRTAERREHCLLGQTIGRHSLSTCAEGDRLQGLCTLDTGARVADPAVTDGNLTSEDQQRLVDIGRPAARVCKGPDCQPQGRAGLS